MATRVRPASIAQPVGLGRGLVLAAMIVCSLSYVINAMDRQVFPSLLVAIDKHYNFALPQGGLLATIFTLGLGLCGILAGTMVQRYGRKNTMLIGIAIYSIFTLLTGVAVGFADMFLYRAFTGAGEAMQNAALFTAVGTYFYRNRAMALGVLNFAYGIGGFFGPLFGTQIFARTGTWQTPFYIYGVLGLIFTVLIALVVPKVFTEAADRAVPDAASDRSGGKLWNRNVVLCAITAAVIGVSMYGYIGLYATYLRTELHYSVPAAGFALSMFGIGALMGIPAGWLGDRFRQRNVILAALVGAMIVGYALFHGFEAPAQQAVLSFLEGTFASGFLFVNVYALIQRSAPPDRVAAASGIFVTCLYLGAAFAGYLFGSLAKAYGWGTAAVIQLDLIVVIGIAAMLMFDDRAARKGTA